MPDKPKSEGRAFLGRRIEKVVGIGAVFCVHAIAGMNSNIGRRYFRYFIIVQSSSP